MKHRHFICIFLFLAIYPAYSNEMDSLKARLSKENRTVQKISLLIEIGTTDTNLERAFEYLEQAYNLSEQIKNDSLMAKSLGLLAENLSFRGYLNKADSIHLKAMEKFAGLQSKNMKVELLNIRGDILYRKGDYEKAANVFMQSYQLAESIQDDENLIRCTNNLGRVFWKISNYDKAKVYFKKTLIHAEKLNNKTYQGSALGNLGLLYRGIGQVDSAIHYYRQSMDLYHSSGDTFHLAINLQNLGVAYQQKQQYDLARQTFIKANQYYQQIDDQEGNMLTVYNLANLLFEIGQQQEGLQYYQQAEILAEENNFQGALMQLYQHMGMAFAQAGNYEDAYQYLQKHLTLKDSIINAEHLASIEELEIKYNTEKKEKELLASNVQLAKRESQLKSLAIAGGAIIISLSLIFVILRKSRENRYQRQSIAAITKAQEKERERIASDLHDSVGSMLAAVKNDLTLKSVNAQEVQLLDQVSSELRQISHAMMPATLQKFGLAAAIRSELERVKLQYHVDVGFNEFGIEGKLTKESEIHIYRIVQEAIQNILKHAKASRISVSVTGSENNLNLLIEDDGKGFKPDRSSLGLGLKNMMTRVENVLNGKFRIDSNLNMGTIINVNVPVG